MDGFLNDIIGLMAVVSMGDIMSADETNWAVSAFRFCGWALRGTRVWKGRSRLTRNGDLR